MSVLSAPHAPNRRPACCYRFARSVRGKPAVTAPPTSTTSTGPRVVWDLGHRPLPEVPLPNDIATLSRSEQPDRFADQRLGAGAHGVRAAIPSPSSTNSTAGARIKGSMCRSRGSRSRNIVRRHQHDDLAFADDAVYLIDLETGCGAARYRRRQLPVHAQSAGPLFRQRSGARAKPTSRSIRSTRI